MARVWARKGLMGGVPCFYGTRIPVDLIRQVVDFKSVWPEDVPHYYPSLSGVDLSHTVRGQA